ncbi:MAG: LUD domain-containing protein, partial [Methanobacterium sp.]
MNTPMDESEIQAMNNSFKILHERRRKLLDNEETRKLKERVRGIREYSIDHLEELKVEAVEKLQSNGVEVIYAEDSKEALTAIYALVKDEKCIAKSKSNTASEIGLTDFLQSKNVEVVETDLGDRIVQFTEKKKSSHPIGPAAHLNLEEIAQVIREKFNRE